MEGERKRLGRWGEEKAEAFLSEKGYRIVERNYRGGRGEIDLICEDGETLVFVEVKTRSHSEFSAPEEAVDQRKRRQLIRLGKRFLVENNLWGKVDCRFDVVTVDYERGIEHIEDAFWA